LLAPERRITTGYPALLGCSTSSNANVHLRRSEAHYAPQREFNSRLREAMLREHRGGRWHSTNPSGGFPALQGSRIKASARNPRSMNDPGNDSLVTIASYCALARPFGISQFR